MNKRRGDALPQARVDQQAVRVGGGNVTQDTGPHPPAVLRPGDTCWRLERAHRAAFLIDAAEYFGAIKHAFRCARRSILILGWDFDPRIRLQPERPEPEVAPDRLGALLKALVRERPELEVRVLAWRKALPVALKYPQIPLRIRNAATDRRLHYETDGRHPPGATHHQKVVVVDDAIAFCGGMDFGRDRFDCVGHPAHNPHRHTPHGRPVMPHHDVMMAVDGDAARALADLFRDRWRRRMKEGLPPVAVSGDPWPPSLHPALTDVDVAVARTDPGFTGTARVAEIEHLFLSAIAGAERSIYIENQYLTAMRLVDALAARLAEDDGPEVILLLPHESPNYFDRSVMDPARDLAIRHLRAADRHGRLGVYAPTTGAGTPVVVHSKVMVVDDRFVTVGSANMNNRSLGLDTECNLALEAGGAGGATAVRTLLHRLLGDHSGEGVAAAAAILETEDSLLNAIETLRRRGGRPQPLDPSAPHGTAALIARHHLLDPRDPEPLVGPWHKLRRTATFSRPGRAVRAFLRMVAGGVRAFFGVGGGTSK